MVLYCSVDPPTTDARHGPSIWLYAPSVPLRLTADEVVFVFFDVVAVLIRSVDLFVIQSSAKDLSVRWLLNILLPPVW